MTCSHTALLRGEGCTWHLERTHHKTQGCGIDLMSAWQRRSRMWRCLEQVQNRTITAFLIKQMMDNNSLSCNELVIKEPDLLNIFVSFYNYRNHKPSQDDKQETWIS